MFGIVPRIQAKVLQLPLPEKAKYYLGHPAGPFTVHFWAPSFKWAITIANLADLKRPAEKISTPQQSVLVATGVIWSRYSTQITPVNYNLLSVNFFMALTAIYQLYRKFDAGILFGDKPALALPPSESAETAEKK
eukprot:GILI01009007.1.p1 GENE.GILI01009007.1~~GILI01009007.1.p1  ORF type:complete len:135 (+),score=50.47 GILI01009007.1:47-451(+)